MSYIIYKPENDFNFTAEWITLPEMDDKPNIYFRACKSFQLDTLPREALLRISAESYYLLFINGKRVNFGPVRGTFRVNYYDILKVANLLKTGVNHIAVMVHSAITETFIAVPSGAAFILELPGIVKSDSSWQVQLAPDWKREVELFSLQTDYMEHRDFRLNQQDWLNGRPEGNWDSARPVSPDSKILSKRLAARDVPPMRESLKYPLDIIREHAVEVRDPEPEVKLSTLLNDDILLPAAGRIVKENSVYTLKPDLEKGRGLSLIMDFGCGMVGRLAVEVDAPAGTVVDVTYGEEVWQEKGDRLRADYGNGGIYNFADRYILADGVNTIGTELSERGFRFVQLTFRNFKSPVGILKMEAFAGEYPYQYRGRFESSDLLLNRIWDVCVRTLQVCTTDAFLDCPWRERAFWVNDMVVENATTLAAFGASEIHRRCFDLAFSQQEDAGYLPGVCPAPYREPRMTLLPTDMFILIMLDDYLMMTGDHDTVRKYLPNVKRILELFESFADEKGIVTPPENVWNFYDWSFELNEYNFRNCRESMLNYLYITGMKLYCRLCESCGAECDPQPYRERIERTARAIEQEFISENGYLRDNVMHQDKPAKISSQLAHAFALLSGEADEKYLGRFKQAVTDPALLCPEYYLHFFIFRAMRDHGGDGALADGLARIRKYWGRAVETGYPTLFEAGIHKFGREAFCQTGSLCHGFGTAPIEFCHRIILGIRPLEPGYRVFEVEPHLFDLESAAGAIPTPRGEIDIDCRRAGSEINIRISIPDGLTGRFNGRDYPAGLHFFLMEN